MTDKTELPVDVASATQSKKIDESLEFDLKDKQSLKTSDDTESLLIALNCNGSAASKRSIAIKCNEPATPERDPLSDPRSNGTVPTLPLSVSTRSLINHSIAPATKRAYASDLAHFEANGGIIPSTPEQIADYLADMSDLFTVATIERRVAALSKTHQAKGFADPTKAEVVRSVMRGIRRKLGTAQRQAKPLLRDDLFVLLDPLKDRPKDIRDRAILLIGFSAGMRRSEIVALNAEDIETVDKGLLITIRRSKTDQEGQGRTVAIPFGRTRYCPVTALKDWLTFAWITQGPIFTAINKHGQISNHRISGEAVSQMLKVRLRDAGYDPTPFSGHSLRAGFATSAAEAGASNLKIRQVTGHKSDTTLNRYIRSTDLFTDAAAGRLL